MQDIVEIEVHAGDLPDGRLGLLMLRNGSERFIALDMSEASREEILHREISNLQASGISAGAATIFRVLPEDVSSLKTSDIGAIIRPLGDRRRAWLADLFLDWSMREISTRAAAPEVVRDLPSAILNLEHPPFDATEAGDLKRKYDPEIPSSPLDHDPVIVRPEVSAPKRNGLDADEHPLPVPQGSGEDAIRIVGHDLGPDRIEKLCDALQKFSEDMRSAMEATQRLSTAQDIRSLKINTSLDVLSRTLSDISRDRARFEALETSIVDITLCIDSLKSPARPSLARRIVKRVAVAFGTVIYGLVAAAFGAIIGWHYGSGGDPLGLFEPGSDTRPLYEWRDAPRQFDL
jgi:hypothetical protein